MLQEVTVIAANRSYEFARDEIRLTVLSHPDVVERIRDAFRFYSFELSPASTPFGEGEPTMPPGLTFDLGYIPGPEDRVAPIRHLYVSARRVAVSVAGPTELAEEAYSILRAILEDTRGPDGGRALGEPVGILDQSEIVARCSFSLDAILAPAYVRSYADALAPVLGDAVLVPEVRFTPAPSDAEYRPDEVPGFLRTQFSLRAERRLEDTWYRSVAPLTTDDHIALLESIDSELSPFPVLPHPGSTG